MKLCLCFSLCFWKLLNVIVFLWHMTQLLGFTCFWQSNAIKQVSNYEFHTEMAHAVFEFLHSKLWSNILLLFSFYVTSSTEKNIVFSMTIMQFWIYATGFDVLTNDCKTFIIWIYYNGTTITKKQVDKLNCHWVTYKHIQRNHSLTHSFTHSLI